MKNKIKVLSDLAGCVGNLGSILSSLDMFEKTSNSLLSLLNDTKKWSGESQEKCVQILQLIQQYEAELRPICEQYQTEIRTLINDADAFKGRSKFVSKIGM